MKVINSGRTYEIYSDDLKTHDKFPAGTYAVRFNEMQGFYFEKVNDLEPNEVKVYGPHISKSNKVFQALDAATRSLGVILSGAKGIGKSLFARVLASRAISRDMPVFIVDKAYQGLATFLDRIEQECVILFDEFEKVFDNKSQETLLGLFDGVSSQKRLYVITCNSTHHVNDFLLNRPGRFHYHFRFENPTYEEVIDYLSDKVKKDFKKEIIKAAEFTTKAPINYDCLRAIAFELNMGTSFENAIQDLNITKSAAMDQEFNITVHFNDGTTVRRDRVDINVFDRDERVVVDHPLAGEGYSYVCVDFDARSLVPDRDNPGSLVLMGPARIKVPTDDDELTQAQKNLLVSHFTAKRVSDVQIGYSFN